MIDAYMDRDAFRPICLLSVFLRFIPHEKLRTPFSSGYSSFLGIAPKVRSYRWIDSRRTSNKAFA